MEKEERHLHLVSDATGETINGIVRACLAQFKGIKIHEHFWSLIRTRRQLDMVIEGIRQWPGMVLYTFVDPDLKKALTNFCKSNDIQAVAILDPLIASLTEYLGKDSMHTPGGQHRLNKEYFSRIEAMNFALDLDDGNRLERISEADVIVIGVSRTSKTPTCIYLANRGIKAANIPLIPGVPPSIDLNALTDKFIVGLTRDPEGLVETRKARLKSLHKEEEDIDYVNLEKVYEETQEARRLFARIGCPVIDVTRRSIEETAAEIMLLISKRELEKEISKKN